MSRYVWSHLNNQQVGAYTEYFVKMELTMWGFQVYETEVDDRGVDFVARYKEGPFFEIQVKALRKPGYVFMQKSKFRLLKESYLAFGLLLDRRPPRLYLIPATTWLEPNAVFCGRDYEGLKSLPEWGINASAKNIPALGAYSFSRTAKRLIVESS
jgi:hypothetical protein